MRVPLVVLLFVCTTYAFQPPKIDVEERQPESHPLIGRFVELREHERLVLRCHGRFDDLIFKFPNLEGNSGYDAANFQDRMQEETDDGFGDKLLTINDVRESDTGTYSCVSEEHQSLNDSIHVFVHGTKIFLPLNSVKFEYNKSEAIVPCKTTEFVDKSDVELYAGGVLLKAAAKNFDHRIGFKITNKLFNMNADVDVTFVCNYTKKPHQEASYIITEKNIEDSEDDYEFYWVEGFEWPHVGYNYSQSCHLDHKGPKTFNKYYHKLRIECDNCNNVNSHVHVGSHKADGNRISVDFWIEHLELEDSINYKCIWVNENRFNKSIDYHLHVAPTRSQIKVIDRSQKLLRVKEHHSDSLFAKFAVYPSDEEQYVATWSRTYNSSIKEGTQSEIIITDDIRRISAKKMSDGSFIETLDLSSAAMTTNMSGTYRLSISHMNTIQSVQWEVAIENDTPDVQINVRKTASFIVFNQPFYPPDTPLHIECVSISIPPASDVIFEQKNKKTGEYEEIDQSKLVNVEGTFEKGFIWDMTLTEDADLRCSSHRQGKKYVATKSVIVADHAVSVTSTIEKVAKATASEPTKVFYEGDNVNLTCNVPSGANWEVSWKYNDKSLESFDTYFVKHSKHVVLRLMNITTSSSGKYSCAVKKDSAENLYEIDVKVESISTPHHTDADSRSAFTVDYQKGLELYCNMTGNPPPEFQWFKNGDEYTFGERKGNLLNITSARAEDDGQFECRASNRAGTTSRFIEVQVENAPKESYFLYYCGIFFIIVVLGIIAFLCVKLRASKRITKQKDIALNELYKSMMESNPGPLPEEMKNLPIEERTYYLPYNRDYEIDACNLEIGNQLGNGNFGVVRKGLLRMADPKSEIEAQVRLPVAVKSSSNPYDVEAQKMMSDELKIMNVIPKHPNVLSLIGAVTTNFRKGQLLIVTEYIDSGNLKDFLKKHRETFVNELVEEEEPVDDSYMVPNSATKKKKYKFEGEEERLLPDDDSLCTSDLLSIGLQIANGMEWLANVPCVHRDLACRNVLITRSKIIRIADFGLSKQHNNKNYYRVKSNKNGALPVRWMSEEAFFESKYSEKSDVWSFGICLHEIFTLGDNPYAGLDNPDIMDFISSGKRNSQPAFCHDDVYELMKNCWQHLPKERPKFSECVYFLKEHMKRCAPELLERVDRMLHLEKEEQLKHEQFIKKSRAVVGRFQKKAPRKPEEERYLIVESHA